MNPVTEPNPLQNKVPVRGFEPRLEDSKATGRHLQGVVTHGESDRSLPKSDTCETKRCTKCGETKPAKAFNRQRSARDGLQSRCRECSRRAGRDHYRRNRRRVIAKACARKRDPLKRKAHQAVARALYSGKLVRQPCEECGVGNADAHHDDYSKPLEVRWLCRHHHRLHHERHGE